MEKGFTFINGGRVLIAEWSGEYGGKYRLATGILKRLYDTKKYIAEVEIDGLCNDESINGYFYFKLNSLIPIDKDKSDKVLIGDLNTGYSFITNKEYQEILMKNKQNKRMVEIEKVIFNNPATIVFWNDGSKTVVKCSEDECFDEEKGLAMAISKKALGNKGNYYNEFKKWLPIIEELDNHIPIEDAAETFRNFGKALRKLKGDK